MRSLRSYRTGVACHRGAGTADDSRSPQSLPRSAAEPAAEIIYQLSKTPSLDARVRQQELIDRLAEVAVDLETLRDAQGRQYQIEADASQRRGRRRRHRRAAPSRTAPRKQTAREIDLPGRERIPAHRKKRWRCSGRVAPIGTLVGAPEAGHLLSPGMGGNGVGGGAAPCHRQAAGRTPGSRPSQSRSSGVRCGRAAEGAGRRDRGAQASTHAAPGAGHGNDPRGRRRDRSQLLARERVRRPDYAGTPRPPIRDERVERIETFAAGRPDALDDMRAAAQIVQLHDGNFTGERASGRNATGDIYVGIIDTDIDMVHPAWNDTSAGFSRLREVWRWNGAAWNTVGVSAVAAPSHGTKVAGVAVGDSWTAGSGCRSAGRSG